MKANQCEFKYKNGEPEPEDLLETFIAEHPERLQDLDKHWKEVMKLAEKYGFIIEACGGTASLSTHKNVFDACGAERVARILRMNNIDIPESWEVF